MFRAAKLAILVLCLLPFRGLSAQEPVAITALASLTDPARLATLKGDRTANSRVLKCIYWLHVSAEAGLSPGAVLDLAQARNTSAIAGRAVLVRAALLRNLDIAGKLGCLTPENLERMRHGRSPVITSGPYAGEVAEIDHIVPIAAEPTLAREIANLELLPRTLNRRKGAQMGERQWDYLRQFRASGFGRTL